MPPRFQHQSAHPLLLGAALLLSGCDDAGELRGSTGTMAPASAPAGPPRVPASALIPGGSTPGSSTPGQGVVHNPYSRQPDAVREGQRLYHWYNCSGCHAEGGGAIGPPLMDQRWIYGGRPANLFDVIVEGRPGGMPAFGGKIPEDQIWKIIAYIATMGGMPAEDAIIAGEGGTSPQHGPSQLQNRAR